MKKVIDNLLLGSYGFDENSKYVCLKRMLNKQDIGNGLTVPLGISDDMEYHYMGFEDVSCLLVTGETGSGKSIFLDSIIISLLLRNDVTDIRFIMIDPKRVELSYYGKLFYMHSDVVSDSLDSYNKLLEVEKEYKKRKSMFQDNNVKNIRGYNNLKEVEKLYHLFVIVD